MDGKTQENKSGITENRLEVKKVKSVAEEMT